MKLTIRYFASVREQLGGIEKLDLPEVNFHNVGDIRAYLMGLSEAHAQALGSDKALRFACNQTLCGVDQPVQDGDEVAFFPPVTGG